MAESITYRGYQIFAKTRQISLSGEWIIEVDIARRPARKRFYSNRTCKTRDEAVAASLEFGKRIIDGVEPQFSPADLPRAPADPLL